jgi:hypothetical protein
MDEIRKSIATWMCDSRARVCSHSMGDEIRRLEYLLRLIHSLTFGWMK